MMIYGDIKLIDLALQIGNSLIISDTHIGYEEALNKQGILIPRFQFKEILQRLGNIISGKHFNKIIVNGDIKHEFGTISETEWRHTLRLLDFLGEHCDEIILIKGNHDTIIGPIATKKNVKVVGEYVINGKMLVSHGDKIPSSLKGIDTIIIGHEHPAIILREGAKHELYKCYLKGNYKSKTLIVQPSFNLVSEGTDILKEKLLSPFLQQNLENFEVFVVADKVYGFGRVKDISG